MGMLPVILFYSLLATFILSLLLTVLNDEMSDFFYSVYDTIIHQVTNISELVRR